MTFQISQRIWSFFYINTHGYTPPPGFSSVKWKCKLYWSQTNSWSPRYNFICVWFVLRSCKSCLEVNENLDHNSRLRCYYNGYNKNTEATDVSRLVVDKIRKFASRLLLNQDSKRTCMYPATVWHRRTDRHWRSCTCMPPPPPPPPPPGGALINWITFVKKWLLWKWRSS